MEVKSWSKKHSRKITEYLLENVYRNLNTREKHKLRKYVEYTIKSSKYVGLAGYDNGKIVGAVLAQKGVETPAYAQIEELTGENEEIEKRLLKEMGKRLKNAGLKYVCVYTKKSRKRFYEKQSFRDMGEYHRYDKRL